MQRFAVEMKETATSQAARESQTASADGGWLWRPEALGLLARSRDAENEEELTTQKIGE